MIVIVDYGGQYVHRIWRSLREIGQESRIVPKSTPFSGIQGEDPVGVVLSGGPASVYEEVADLGEYGEILDSGLPVLGICFGHQLLAHHFGGRIRQGASGEYAEVEIMVTEAGDLFQGLPDRIRVWMSHRDEVAAIPECLVRLAYSDVCEYEAIRHESLPVYGVQFHPEVHHTPLGSDILKNFVGVCRR